MSFVVNLGSCDEGTARGADVGAPRMLEFLARGDMIPP
jgi:hypothetical protein